MGIVFELVLVFSLVIGFGVYELYSLRQLEKEREAKEREAQQSATETASADDADATPGEQGDERGNA